MSEIYGFDKLDIAARFDAPLTEDTLVIVPDKEGVGLIQRIVVLLSLKSGSGDTQLIGIPLKLTGTAFLTGHAVERMVGEKELDYQSPGLDDSLGVGSDYHVASHRVGTGGY